MVKKIGLLSFIFVFISMAVIICFSKGTQNENSQKITIALDWTPNTNHTGIYIAKQLGFFRDEGLAVSIIQPPEGDCANLVACKKVDFGIDAQDFLAPAFAAENPLPIKAIAAINQHNTAGIISRKEVNIKGPGDLSFKKYATFDNPIEHFILDYSMAKEGKRFCDLNLIHAKIENVPMALKNGIDACLIFYGIEGIATKLSSIDSNFFFLCDIDPCFDYYTPVIISNTEYIENNKDTVRAFIRALSKGYNYATDNPLVAAKILISAVPELNEKLIIKSQEFMSKQYKAESRHWGFIDPLRWNSFYHLLFEKNIINREIPATAFTNEFIHAL